MGWWGGVGVGCAGAGWGALRVMETQAPRVKDGHSCEGLQKVVNYALALKAAT